MKTIIKTTIAALALALGASASQAQPVVEWHYSPKGGAPYGVWVEPAQKAAPYATQAKPAKQVAHAQTVRHGKHVHLKIASKKQVIR